jgi:beta-aspartyl-peptidase (threonine type)
MLEDDPIFNAGAGSVLNEKGEVEMDASIMDGRDMSAGAVAAVTNIKNPVSLARLVMEKSKHVLLLGTGAMEFAKKWNVEIADRSYFITDARQKQWEAARDADALSLDHSTSQPEKKINNKMGTVGAVALDSSGNLAAATSTGGLVNKSFGRVGDSPIVGSGVFADNDTCAVSCMGVGEHMIRTNVAKMVSDFMLMQNKDVAEASVAAIEYFSKRISGMGGFIAVGKDGKFACEFTTPQMIYGFTTTEHEPAVRFDTLTK